MAGTTIWNVIADFNTTLNLKVAVGATTATLDSATDDDGVALPTGTYFLTLDGGSVSSKEYIKCTLTGTALTYIQSVSRQGALTSGFARTHRKGATVTITDFASIRKITDLLDGTTSNADMTFTDLSFTGTTTAGLKVKTLTTTQRNAITPANGQIVYDSTLGENYQYIGGAWSAISAWSTQPNAGATVAGKVEIATSAESIAGTDTGGTGALLSVLPSDIKTNLFTATQWQASVYGADAGGDDTYVVALTPTLASYTTGQKLSFKPTTANTGACTIDFWPGVKNIKTIDGNDPQTGVIRANGVYTVVYDGTSFILQNEDFATTNNKGIVEMATDAEANTATDETRYINSKQAKDNYWKFSSWVSTKDLADASGAQTIAHWLGRIPKNVKITAAAPAGTTNPFTPFTVYNGTTQSSLSYYGDGSTLWYRSATWALLLGDSSWARYQSWVVTFDSTNITITWTKTSVPTGTMPLIWEAQ